MFISKIENKNQLKSAINNIEEFLGQREIKEDLIFNIKLVVMELVSNILRYNICNAEINLDRLDDYILIVVKNSAGYDAKEIKCPSIDAENGRGLFLVKNLSDSLEIKDEGKLIEVKIKL